MDGGPSIHYSTVKASAKKNTMQASETRQGGSSSSQRCCCNIREDGPWRRDRFVETFTHILK